MIEFPLLSLITFLPLVAAFFIMTIRGDDPRADMNGRYVALFASLFTCGLSVFMALSFNESNPDFQFVERYEWLGMFGAQYALGVDGISLFFVVLSSSLTPICIIASWKSIQSRVREYMAAFLILETLMVGTFLALDTILFYIFFEAVLIPMFLIIGIWGGQRRIYASFKFFLYTLLGSILMLLAMLVLYFQAGTTSIESLPQNLLSKEVQIWLWLAFFASFAVKMPMWPFHTWLPDAHVEAPTAGSVILAGVLLKMGGYGFLRFSLPVFPEATEFFAPMVLWMSVIAIIYTSLVALVQTDIKKLIAYSSVAHMGFVTLGIFSVTTQGIEGGIFQMISHGLISGALFLCVGVIYDRLHTREIEKYGGLVKNMPKYATVFMILMLGSVGLPGTSGFVGEFLALLGTFQVFPIIAAFATTGIIFGAAYMLILYKRVIFGEQKSSEVMMMKDLKGREMITLFPLCALVLWLGVAPGIVMDRVAPSVEKLIAQYEAGLSAGFSADLQQSMDDPVTEEKTNEESEWPEQ